MRKTSSFKFLIILSIVFSVLSSLPILSMIFIHNESISFFADNEKMKKMFIIIFASLLYIGTIIEQVSLWIANSIRKKINDRNAMGKIGLISFFQTIPGIITDGTFALTFIAYLISLFFSKDANTFQYILMFLMVLSFRLHCILNGKNFRYLLNSKKEKRNND